MKLECEIWLTATGRAFGPACARMLHAIEGTGSVRKAAAELHTTPCWAWQMINSAERALGFPLVGRVVGGRRGGGSTLTPAARELLRRYSDAEAETEAFLAETYSRHFSHIGAHD